ncbi:hypothetical protein PROVRETT_07246 [Providencia rettgeri DSM 1131]|nr:hypothetical protein PROVRETT_07246 [Providencia rettgeri DSM 1131]
MNFKVLKGKSEIKKRGELYKRKGWQFVTTLYSKINRLSFLLLLYVFA